MLQAHHHLVFHLVTIDERSSSSASVVAAAWHVRWRRLPAASAPHELCDAAPVGADDAKARRSLRTRPAPGQVGQQQQGLSSREAQRFRLRCAQDARELRRRPRIDMGAAKFGSRLLGGRCLGGRCLGFDHRINGLVNGEKHRVVHRLLYRPLAGLLDGSGRSRFPGTGLFPPALRRWRPARRRWPTCIRCPRSDCHLGWHCWAVARRKTELERGTKTRVEAKMDKTHETGVCMRTKRPHSILPAFWSLRACSTISVSVSHARKAL